MKNASLLIHPSELSEKWIDRIVTEGIPTLALHPEGGPNAHLSLEKMIDLLSTPGYRTLLDKAAEKGLMIEYEMHAARYLLPESEFDSHPDWFRMNGDGKRVPDHNFCASNDDAIEYVAERANELVKKLYRSTDRYYLWLDDGKNTSCRCPMCSSLSPSDQQLIILNRILRRLKQDNENASLAYLAYCDTAEAPKQMKPEQGIFLEYAPFLRDPHRPLREDEESKHLTDLISFFGKDNSKALDYWYDNSMYSEWKKPPAAFKVDKAVIKEDFKLYSELGFSYISSFACFLGEDYEELHGEPDVSDFGTLLRSRISD